MDYLLISTFPNIIIQRGKVLTRNYNRETKQKRKFTYIRGNNCCHFQVTLDIPDFSRKNFRWNIENSIQWIVDKIVDKIVGEEAGRKSKRRRRQPCRFIRSEFHRLKVNKEQQWITSKMDENFKWIASSSLYECNSKNGIWMHLRHPLPS